MIDPTVHRIESLLRNPVVFIGGATVLTVLLAAALVAAFPLYRDLLSDPFWFPIIVMAVILFLILNSTAVCILAERKIASFTQDRRGPNRVGFWGLLQPIADGMKFFFKEDIIPRYVDKPLFLLAPCVSLIVSLIGFAIIPWAGEYLLDCTIDKIAGVPAAQAQTIVRVAFHKSVPQVSVIGMEDQKKVLDEHKNILNQIREQLQKADGKQNSLLAYARLHSKYLHTMLRILLGGKTDQPADPGIFTTPATTLDTATREATSRN